MCVLGWHGMLILSLESHCAVTPASATKTVAGPLPEQRSGTAENPVTLSHPLAHFPRLDHLLLDRPHLWSGFSCLNQDSNIKVLELDSEMIASEIIASLKGLSPGDLDGVIAAAERERQAKREAGRKALQDEVRAKAEALGISLESLLQGAEQTSPKGARAPVRAKYRNPETGETWSGRGSAPGWLKRLEDGGSARDEFAVGDESQQAA
jgi:DNA-binding protein H-NS